MKRLAILIPVYNHIDYTIKCLENLDTINKNSSGEFHVDTIIIDDGSTDNTSGWIRSNRPDIIVLQGDGNLWWSGAVNVGARYVFEKLKSDFLLLWNNDIISDSAYFQNLQNILKNLPDKTILGSKIYKSFENKIIWSYGGCFNPKTGKKYMYGYNKPDGPEYETKKSVDWLPGMGTVVPIKALTEVGYWNEKEFPQYHGDSDYTYRAKLTGYDLVVHPELKIWNDTTRTGLKHQGSIKMLLRTFKDIKSQHNISKNYLFYKKYAMSVRAYLPPVRSYFRMIGGFIKWKVLGWFNLSNNK